MEEIYGKLRLPQDLTISFCGWHARWRIWTAEAGFATGIWRRQSATEALTESSGRGEEMNYAYWFANIPGLSNCAKISIHEKVGNAQDIYFLSEKQMENMQLLAKEIQAVRAAQRRTWRKRTLRCVNPGSRLCRWRMHLIQRGSAISQIRRTDCM